MAQTNAQRIARRRWICSACDAIANPPPRRSCKACHALWERDYRARQEIEPETLRAQWRARYWRHHDKVRKWARTARFNAEIRSPGFHARKQRAHYLRHEQLRRLRVRYGSYAEAKQLILELNNLLKGLEK